MRAMKYWTPMLAFLFIQGCSPSPPPPAPPPPTSDPAPPKPKTVFDPLTQQLDRARDVQRVMDQNAAATRKSVDSEERGDNSN